MNFLSESSPGTPTEKNNNFWVPIYSWNTLLNKKSSQWSYYIITSQILLELFMQMIFSSLLTSLF